MAAAAAALASLPKFDVAQATVQRQQPPSSANVRNRSPASPALNPCYAAFSCRATAACALQRQRRLPPQARGCSPCLLLRLQGSLHLSRVHITWRQAVVADAKTQVQATIRSWFHG